eukprot:GHVU01190525.1.p2 GENE.GHVU01190525.1~~GHVU01190525.1.p2  ORF type:complete len:130 (-),score=2.98 GHVU01190525.1:447-836(-)
MDDSQSMIYLSISCISVGTHNNNMLIITMLIIMTCSEEKPKRPPRGDCCTKTVGRIGVADSPLPPSTEYCYTPTHTHTVIRFTQSLAYLLTRSVSVTRKHEALCHRWNQPRKKPASPAVQLTCLRPYPF